MIYQSFKKVRSKIYWIKVYLPRKIKFSVATLLKQSGFFSPFMKVLYSKINDHNFQEFVKYGTNYEKFVSSSIMLEKFLEKDKKFVADLLMAEAQKYNHVEAQTVLKDYFA